MCAIFTLCCCRLSVVPISYTVAPAATHVTRHQELAPRMHIPCHGMQWLWGMLLKQLPVMSCALEAQQHVLPGPRAVSRSRYSIAAVPRATRVIHRQEVASWTCITCQGMQWLSRMLINHLQTVLSAPMASQSVLMGVPAVRWSQENMAAVLLLRYILPLWVWVSSISLIFHPWIPFLSSIWSFLCGSWLQHSLVVMKIHPSAVSVTNNYDWWYMIFSYFHDWELWTFCWILVKCLPCDAMHKCGTSLCVCMSVYYTCILCPNG